MYKLVLKLIWNALPLVALGLIIWWGYSTFANLSPAEPSTISTVTDRAGIVESIKQVNKQVFIEHYNMVDVQYTEAPEGWIGVLGLKQEVIVLVRGQVPAGFNLQQITEDNIWVSSDGKRAQLTLPPPTIFEDNVAIDFENSRVLVNSDTCPNFLCPQDTLVAYQEQVLPAAKTLLIDYANENGILDQTATDGKAYYQQFLQSLGFEDVQVIVAGYE